MSSKSFKLSPLLVLGMLVLVVASMYWARPVLIPVALAMLLTFVLSPVDTLLRRFGIARGFSVTIIAFSTLTLVIVIGWAVSVQVEEFANHLPGYQGNLKKRIDDLQVGKGTTLDRVRVEFEQLLGDVKPEPDGGTPSEGPTTAPVLVKVQEQKFSSGMWQLSPILLPVLESLVHIFLVVMLVIFMLLEREELRNRVIRVLGYGRLSVTTQALDEAGQRVSHYLFSQFIINGSLGLSIGLGLFFLGVPYALMWGFLVMALRFIPYVGIWIAAILPFAVSLATSSTWWQPLSVLALFAVLEPIVGMVIEPLLFSRSAGTSNLSMLIAIAFWAWLWGPVGLLLATPMTACLAVVAKYVPQLEFIAVLLGDQQVMRSSGAYYKLLAAQEQDEAEAIVEEQLKLHSAEQVFDEVFIPALHYAKRDSHVGLLTEDELEFIYRSMREIIERIGVPAGAAIAAKESSDTTPPADRLRVQLWPAHDEGDAIALLMLKQLLDPARFEVVESPAGGALSEVVKDIESKRPAVLCVGFVPPGGLSAARRLIKQLHTQQAELTIVAGHWGLLEKVGDARELLTDAGATHVTATLIEARDQITQAGNADVKLQPAKA